MRLKKYWHSIRLLLCGEGYARAEYIRKHNLFGAMGKDCYFHPFLMPGDPKSIFIHDNVKIASNVTFINHDIANAMLNKKNNTDEYQYYCEPIEIFDNVLIGTNTTILPGRKIGPNSVVGGGTVVARDVEEGTVVAGNPCKVIGNFECFEMKRKDYKIDSRR